MDQKFEGAPKAELRLEGRMIVRTPVSNDWGSKLQWQVSRDGKVVASVPARMTEAYTHADQTPGRYEVVLQIFKYIDYRKDKNGQYINSKFIDISNKVAYQV